MDSQLKSFLGSAIVAISGILAARAIRDDIPILRIEGHFARMIAGGSAVIMFALAMLLHRSKPSLSNVILFASTWCAGLVQW
jgi:hypothetical protein